MYRLHSPVYNQDKSPNYPLNRTLDEPQVWYDRDETNFLALCGIETRFLGRPARKLATECWNREFRYGNCHDVILLYSFYNVFASMNCGVLKVRRLRPRKTRPSLSAHPRQSVKGSSLLYSISIYRHKLRRTNSGIILMCSMAVHYIIQKH
jgi:hypothetical protein